jgi:hypothetical protein
MPKKTTRSPRKIVQITATADGYTGEGGEFMSAVFALADDGTLWEGYFHPGCDEWTWHERPALPPRAST